MASRSWNHNTRYHAALLRSVPSHTHRALDIGCGDGSFARRLASRADRVVAIDTDPAQVGKTELACVGLSNVTVVEADLLAAPFEDASFDLATALAVLHHVPFEEGVGAMVRLLRPGGTLLVLGVWEDRTTRTDALWNQAGSVANRTYQRLWGPDVMSAPQRPPAMTLREVRLAARLLLPGSRIRRYPLWRCTLVWRKPGRPGPKPGPA